jgi:sugar phosphate permease
MMPSADSDRDLRRLLRLRWAMWGLGALTYFGVMFERYSASPMADRLMADFGVSAGSLGALAGLQLFTYTVMQIPAGALADSLGPRRVLGMGALFGGLGTLAFSLAPNFELATVGRIMLGLGDSVVFVNVLRLQAEWFRPREYATLAGLTACSAGLGGLGATAPLAWLVEAFGWRAPLAISGLVLLVIAVLCWLFVRDRPSELGLPSWPETEAEKSYAGRREAGLSPPSLRTSLSIVIGNPQTWWAGFSHLALFAPYLALTTVWGVPYLMQAHGLSRSEAGVLLGLAPLAYFLSGPLLGYLSDRLGQRRSPMLAVEVLLVGVWLTLATQHDLPPPLVGAMIFLGGIGGGACLLAFAGAKEANPPAMSGLATGFANVGGFGGGAALQLLIGVLLDVGWAGQQVGGARVYPVEAYGAAFFALAATTFLAAFGTLRLRR